MDADLAPKHACESHTETTHIVLPSHTNPLGTAFGGQIMAWIDVCASIAAQRHARQIAVTVSIDDVHFREPIHQGQVAVLTAQVNRAFRTSMEVGVRVEMEDPRTGVRRHTNSAYLTFVALDRHGNRVRVPALIPDTETERRRFEEAAERRRLRLERRNRRRDSATDPPA